MNPMIVENTRAKNSTVKCTSCFELAQRVWIDQWGTVPLCASCCDAREERYLAWLETEKGKAK
jgi:hypothetical protein